MRSARWFTGGEILLGSRRGVALGQASGADPHYSCDLETAVGTGCRRRPTTAAPRVPRWRNSRRDGWAGSCHGLRCAMHGCEQVRVLDRESAVGGDPPLVGRWRLLLVHNVKADHCGCHVSPPVHKPIMSAPGWQSRFPTCLTRVPVRPRSRLPS